MIIHCSRTYVHLVQSHYSTAELHVRRKNRKSCVPFVDFGHKVLKKGISPFDNTEKGLLSTKETPFVPFVQLQLHNSRNMSIGASFL